MSGPLQPVAFEKRIKHKPRISAPYVPGRNDKRYWTDAEIEIVRQHYPTGGVAACLAHLPAHRTASTVYAQANKLGLRSEKMTTERTSRRTSPEMDETIRTEWAKLSGHKKGEVTALADRLGIPRWVLSNRAGQLGLTVAHQKEPRWTAAEDALMATVPLAYPDRCANIFREHGFRRSPTAIVIRAKRLGLSRRNSRETMSATQAAKILGVDVKMVTRHIIAGDLPAEKRDDERLPQQGGSAWDIRPADLKAFILDQIAIVDLRKVDKVLFVDLVATHFGEPA